MRRREFISGVAAAARGSAWPDRLGVMCQIGNEEASARHVLAAARQAGFARIQLFFPWDKVDETYLKTLPGWLRTEGLRCEALSAYTNCVNPAAILMSTRAGDFPRAVAYAGELGCSNLVAWTGSYGSALMKADPRNFTAEAQDAIIRFFEPHLRRIEDAGVKVALESYITLACPDAPALRKLLDRLPKTIGTVLDPPNLTPLPRYGERDRVLREMTRELAGRIVVVHLKDFRIAKDGQSYDLPGPLAGEMNYRIFADEIRRLPEKVPVIAEHIGPDQFASTRSKLLPVFAR